MMPVYGSYILFCAPNTPVVESCSDAEADIRMVKDFTEMRPNDMGVNKEDMERILSNSSDLFAFFDGDRPVGMMWGHRGDCFVRGPGIPIIQGENSVYWFWIFTEPNYRRLHVYKRLRDRFFSHYRSVERFNALVHPENTKMIEEMGRLGFQPLKKVYYVGISSIRLLVSFSNKKIRFELTSAGKYARDGFLLI